MMRRLILRPEAEFDLAEAFGWYEDRQPGLGAEWMQAVDATLTFVRENPNACPTVLAEVRRALVHRFPYAVFYVVEEVRVVVLSVLHVRRDPKHWPTGEL
jgi:toxin ParE1/3/4